MKKMLKNTMTASIGLHVKERPPGFAAQGGVFRPIAPATLSHLRHESRKNIRRDRLVPVGQRLFRIRVDLDDQAVGSGGNRRPAHREHEVMAAGPVARIHDDRAGGRAA